MSEEIISKIIRDNEKIGDDIFESIKTEYNEEDDIFSIRKKTVTAKRNRTIKISLNHREMIRLLGFLEWVHYENGE